MTEEQFKQAFDRFLRNRIMSFKVEYISLFFFILLKLNNKKREVLTKDKKNEKQKEDFKEKIDQIHSTIIHYWKNET